MCGASAAGITVGNTQIPNSSHLNTLLPTKLWPSMRENLLLKSLGLKCSEHIEYCESTHLACLSLTKSTHFLHLFFCLISLVPGIRNDVKRYTFFLITYIATTNNTSFWHFKKLLPGPYCISYTRTVISHIHKRSCSPPDVTVPNLTQTPISRP